MLLLGSFLALIGGAMEASYFYIDAQGMLLLIELAVLAVIVVVLAQACRAWHSRNRRATGIRDDNLLPFAGPPIKVA